jgi:hypothetical protein
MGFAATLETFKQIKAGGLGGRAEAIVKLFQDPPDVRGGVGQGKETPRVCLDFPFPRGEGIFEIDDAFDPLLR